MVAIIILNYNNAENTISCIQSILQYNTVPVKIIVIDNGSSDNSIQEVNQFFCKVENDNYKCIQNKTPKDNIQYPLPEFVFFLNNKNDGYAKGNNYGLELIDKDYEIDKVLILNNDILFVEDIIPCLQKANDQLQESGIISPILYTKELKDIDYTCARKSPSNWNLIVNLLSMNMNIGGLRNKIEENGFILKQKPDLIHEEMIEIELPSGSCMFFDKKLFKEIGWFDTHTFLYYEENILYKKMQLIGKTNYILPRVKCIHLGASTIKSKVSSFIIKCNTQSCEYYLEQYGNLSILQKLFLKIGVYMMKIKILIFKMKEK